MADLGFDFDPASAPADDRNFDPLPSGQYEAEIVASEVRDTKSGNGRLLALTWKIVAGAYENRQIWQNINIMHDNAQAQEIGQKQLRGVCDALGVAAVRDTEDLHFKPAVLVVGVQKNDATRNEVKQVKPLGGAPAPAQQQRPPASRQQQAASQQRQATAGGGSAPWRR